MKKCKKCNGNNELNSNFCEHCGEVFRDETKVVKDKYVTNSNILLAENEINVRSYLCTKLPLLQFLNFTPFAGNGYVSITNKRVIYYGESGTSNMFTSEVAIDTVTGFKTNKSVKFGIIIFLILFAFSAGLSEAFVEDSPFISLIILIVGIIISIKAARKKTFNFTVFSNGSQASALDISASSFASNVSAMVTSSIFGSFKVSINPLPAEDTIKVINEIGAIVMDIKNLGDFALEKWCIDTAKIEKVQECNINSDINSEVATSHDDGEFF